METFEDIYEKSTQTHLTEKLVDGTKNEFQRLIIQAQNDELLYHNLYTKIKYTPFKFMSSDKNVLEYKLFDIIEFIIEKKYGMSFFIENKEDKIIAFISYYENENDPSIIESVKIANLYEIEEEIKKKQKKDKNYKTKDEDGDILCDTLELMSDLLKKYKEVNYSALVSNEKAVRVYDAFFKRHKGDPKNKTQNGNEINWKLFQESN